MKVRVTLDVPVPDDIVALLGGHEGVIADAGLDLAQAAIQRSLDGDGDGLTVEAVSSEVVA